MARQLTLDLPVTPAFGVEDFLVGQSNARAFAMVESWPDWPERLLLLIGPEGSGKSHLGAIWSGAAGATRIPASDLTDDLVPELAARPAVLVEDLDRGLADERALFHLVNVARERRHDILLTSSLPVTSVGLRVPDLLSRLRRAPSVELHAPDDALLRAVLVKLFHDRQVTVEANVVDYVAARIERSLAAAARIVARLDQEALSQGRRVTRPIAASVLVDERDEDHDAFDRHLPVVSGS